jgi:hypothetical protein
MTIFILVVLGLLGSILVLVGLVLFVNAIRRHPYLLRISGTVLSVDEKYDTKGDNVTFSPTIAYTTPEGQKVRFRSKTGATREIRRLSGTTVSPWREGQNIEIFHDPSGTLEPCIASLWSLYGMGIGLLTGGILLLIVVVNKGMHLGGP